MPAGSILLGDVAQHLASVDVACNFCERRGKVSIARLMREHGPEMPFPTILRMLSVDYPRRAAGRIAEPCGVHMPELLDTFAPRAGGSPSLTLAGFSGPLDHLLTLARAHQIDLFDISLAALVEQLAAALRQAPATMPLGQKADWVV